MTIPNRVVSAIVASFLLLGCATEPTDDYQGHATVRGDEMPLVEAMDLCGGRFSCTMFGGSDGPIGPIHSTSFGSDTSCLLTELAGENGELTGYLADGSALIFDVPATWTQSGNVITLRPRASSPEPLRLVCTAQGR